MKFRPFLSRPFSSGLQQLPSPAVERPDRELPSLGGVQWEGVTGNPKDSSRKLENLREDLGQIITTHPLKNPILKSGETGLLRSLFSLGVYPCCFFRSPVTSSRPENPILSGW